MVPLSLLRVSSIACVLALGVQWASAGDVPLPPSPPAVVQPTPPQQGPIRAMDPMASRRPHQVAEVIDAASPEALALKLKELSESGFYISSMTSITTANGKPVLIVVGIHQNLQPMRPPGIGQAPGAQGPGAPGPQPGQLSQPGPLGTPLPAPAPPPPR